jgi:glycerol-3-phosphate O-acyltransferase
MVPSHPLSQVPQVQPALALVAPPRRGGALGRLLSPFFSRIRVDREATDRLREAHQKGIVIHTFRSRRILDPTFLLYLLDQVGLPAPAWLHDHHLTRQAPTVQALVETARAGASALVFLRKPRTLIGPSPAYSEPYFETLVALQREIDRPILLLPEVLLGTKQPVGLRRTIIDTIFGDREAPGRLRELLGFFWWYDTARFHVGAPVDIAAVIERERGKPDRVIAKKIRWSILHHLGREDRVRTGPLRVPVARTREKVLSDPAVRRAIEKVAADGEPLTLVERRAHGILEEMVADLRYGWIRVVDASLDLIWSRIYDGIIVDQDGLAKVRNAARKGPVVLVPSHKSHIDYLVMSQIFFKEGIAPPMIAAGDNLNFWPMGLIFRRSGAFFLRRSFKSDRLYAELFAGYLRRLLTEGNAIEFFIEGGRSRTGKLLPPKMGMLSMCVAPVVDGDVSDVSFIPASISYEKVIEARSYRRELEGGAKRKEDVTALLESTKVLRSRYGRVFVDFADPISLRVFAASRGYDIGKREPRQAESPDGPRRQLVTQLGHRIVYAINQATRVTPTAISALVLLARPLRGIGEEELYRGADRFLELLEKFGARRSRSLDAETRRAAIREAFGRLAADGLIGMVPAPDGETVIQTGDEGRRALDYYKNNILHFFVPTAIVALAVLAAHDGDYAEIARIARRISQYLKFEFSFRDRAFEDNLRQAGTFLASRRTISIGEVEGKETWAITLVGREEAALLAGLLGVFFEAFRLAAECIDELPAPEKKATHAILSRGRKQVLEGRIVRAEAASKPCIESAIKFLVEDGVIEREGAELRVKDREKQKAIVDELSRYLGAMR